MFVSLGAIASMPIDDTSLSSMVGFQVTPLLMDFHTPLEAPAIYIVFDGAGMPCTSERRPMKFDGPTLRQRNTPTTEESSACADRGAANAMALAAPTTAVTRRCPCIPSPAEWGMNRR